MGSTGGIYGAVSLRGNGSNFGNFTEGRTHGLLVRIQFPPPMVYLIHFHSPYKHARHYLGFAATPKKFKARMESHLNGTGANLLRVVNLAGITWDVVRKWPKASRQEERRIKNMGGLSRVCPVCKKLHNEKAVTTPASANDGSASNA